MGRYAVIVNLLFIIVSNVNAQTDYCQLCSTHLACTRRNNNCGVDSSCGTNAKQISLTNEDLRSILDLHNTVRNKVATGKETIGNQPSASNMNALNYNTELGYIAQCLTNTCKFQHDICRSTTKYSWVGQNLGIRKFGGTLRNYKSVINSTIQSWYNEVKDFDASWVSSYDSHGKNIGHYSQLIWAITKEVGCAMTFYVEGGWNNYLLACNYGPGGNILTEPVYKTGTSASQCSGMAVNTKYPGLCGNDDL